MKCCLPNTLRDEQLLAYLDSESTPTVAHHIEACPACQAQLTALAQREHRLTTAFYRLLCPSPLLLGEYQLKLLSTAEQATIADHLAQCPHCTEEVAQLQDFMAVVASDLAPVTPRRVPLAEHLHVVVARLRDGLQNLGIEGALTPALMPVRGNEAVQQIFDTTDGLQIIIDSQGEEPTRQHRTLLGLIVGTPTPAALHVALWQDDRPIASTMVDALGNFVLTDLAPGVYTLFLSNAETAYQIEELHL